MQRNIIAGDNCHDITSSGTGSQNDLCMRKIGNGTNLLKHMYCSDVPQMFTLIL